MKISSQLSRFAVITALSAGTLFAQSQPAKKEDVQSKSSTSGVHTSTTPSGKTTAHHHSKQSSTKHSHHKPSKPVTQQ